MRGLLVSYRGDLVVWNNREGALRSPIFFVVKTHCLVGRVEDKPGVLSRVASLFRRRNFNIESLTVGRTSESGISRMTIVLDSDQASAKRVTAYLYKLINVLQVEDLGSVPAVARDLALVNVPVGGHRLAVALLDG